jgi:hypothetical protein
MQVATLVVETLILLIGLYLVLFKSYFQEKGKNLATKEDIEEITQKVEVIKNNISFLTQTKLNLSTEERISLVNCYEKYYSWLNIILDSYFGGVNEENQSKLREMIEKIDEAKVQYVLAASRLELFINNDEISKLIQEIRVKTIDLQHDFERHSGQIEYIFFEMTKMRSTIPLPQQSEHYQKLLDKKGVIINDYNELKLKKFENIAPLNRRFQVLSYNHLRNLANT